MIEIIISLLVGALIGIFIGILFFILIELKKINKQLMKHNLELLAMTSWHSDKEKQKEKWAHFLKKARGFSDSQINAIMKIEDNT